MREIKFRAWNKRRNEMVRFDLFNPLVRNWWEHVKETTMQYTGLKDKQGKEIYEGDILKYNDYMWNFKADQIHIGVVRWQDWNGAFDCERRMIDGKEVKPEHGLPGIQFKYQAEVIGNIYENPELLEGENG